MFQILRRQIKDKNFCSYGADILEHRKTLNKINKIHYKLYVDNVVEKIRIRKEIESAQGVGEKGSVIFNKQRSPH